MYESKYYKKLQDGKVQCLLCPQLCLIADSQTGICRGRRNSGGTLYSVNYGKTTTLAIDPMEKKPLFHFLPGEEILSLSANSCNFACCFCQNYSISQFDAQTKKITPEELIEICQNNNCRNIAFTYTEPFTWYEFIYDCAVLAKDNNLNIVLVTNGYVNQAPLMDILPYISAMNIDLKSINDDFYEEMCEGSLAPVKKTIENSFGKCHIEITNLLVTDKNDSTDEIRELCRYVSEVSPEIPLHISRYFPNYKLNDPPTPENKIIEAFNIAREYLNYAYLGNSSLDSGKDTFCPDCGNHLIKRRGYEIILTGLKGNTCNKCNHVIYGKFN